MQPTLFEMPPVTNPAPRPKDKDAWPAAAEALFVQLNKYHPQDFSLSEKEDIESQLIKAMDRCEPSYDGYDMGKALEDDFYWEIDSDLVSDLDCTSNEVYNERQRLVKQWVVDSQIKPTHPIGTSVLIPLTTTVGVIDEIREDTAEYLVAVEGKSGRYIIKYEDAKPYQSIAVL